MARREGARSKFSLNYCASLFVPATMMSARPDASVVSSSVEADVAFDVFDFCSLRAGCHWETASEMILAVVEAICARLV
jgi:hypothetical protein